MAAVPAVSTGQLSRGARTDEGRDRRQCGAVRHGQRSGDDGAESKGAGRVGDVAGAGLLADDQVAVCDCAVCMYWSGACVAGGGAVLGCEEGGGGR